MFHQPFCLTSDSGRNDEISSPAVGIVQRVAMTIAAGAGWVLPTSLGVSGWAHERLLAEMRAGAAYAHSVIALEAMKKAGLTLGILSNVDDDLLSATRQHFTVDFDIIITAQQVSSYKPGRAHFDAARKQIGNRRWLHAAQSWFHDVVPARRLGIPVVWVNRKDEPLKADVRPNGMVADLAGLVRWLES